MLDATLPRQLAALCLSFGLGRRGARGALAAFDFVFQTPSLSQTVWTSPFVMKASSSARWPCCPAGEQRVWHWTTVRPRSSWVGGARHRPGTTAPRPEPVRRRREVRMLMRQLVHPLPADPEDLRGLRPGHQIRQGGPLELGLEFGPRQHPRLNHIAGGGTQRPGDVLDRRLPVRGLHPGLHADIASADGDDRRVRHGHRIRDRVDDGELLAGPRLICLVVDDQACRRAGEPHLHRPLHGIHRAGDPQRRRRTPARAQPVAAPADPRPHRVGRLRRLRFLAALMRAAPRC